MTEKMFSEVYGIETAYFLNVTKAPINDILSPDSDIIEVGTILWAAVNAVLLIFIIGGNTLTIIAIRTCRRLRAVISNLFILSLAVSDLIVGIGLPYHVAFYLGSGIGQVHILCFTRFFLMIFACCVSILTLISIAIDRYIAIVYPLHYGRYMTRRVAYVIITINWFSGALVATIPMFWNNWTEAETCEFEDVLPYGYIVGIITPGYILVWVFMLLLYCRIMQEASKQARQTPSCSDWKSIQIVVLIMSLFTICWLPYFIVVCAKTFQVSEKSLYVYKATFSLAMSNSGWNPIIYAWKNRNFRRAFIELLCCRNPNNRAQSLNNQKSMKATPHCELQSEEHEGENESHRDYNITIPPATLKGIYIMPINTVNQNSTNIRGNILTSINPDKNDTVIGESQANAKVCVICKRCLHGKNGEAILLSTIPRANNKRAELNKKRKNNSY